MHKLHRRIISAALAFLCAVCGLALPAGAEAYGASYFIRGDVNGDDSIDALDALLALRISLGFDDPTSLQRVSGDMNHDGTVDSTDALLILHKTVEAIQVTAGSSTLLRQNAGYNPYVYDEPVQGIDVSFWQGDVDFNAVKACGIDFVILRAGGATDDPSENHEGIDPRRQGVDAWFERNYKKAKAAGLNVGVYWFSFAENEYEAYREAESCLKALEGKQLEYPVFYDIEMDYQFDLGQEYVSSIMDIFCRKIRSGGYYPAFYMSTFFATHYLSGDIKQKYDCWLAQWSGDINYESSYTMWQYGTRGVDGVSGEVDADLSYFNYPAYIKKTHLNNW